MHKVELEANLVGDSVRIDIAAGNPAPHLARNSNSHRFEFELTDKTTLGVRLKPLGEMLDVKDDWKVCPPPPGMDTTQIVGITRKSNTEAGFTDNNSNPEEDMPVTYQLNFECNDATKHPIAFDPTITNGGHT